MIVTCPSCQSRYRFDEAKLGDRPRARTRCAKCGGNIDIENPAFAPNLTLPPSPEEPPPPRAVPRGGDKTMPPGGTTMPPSSPPRRAAAPAALADGGQTVTGVDLHKLGVLELPRGKRFSLAVIQGPATGQIFQVTSTRTTLGRSGADITLDDPEASRQHAVLEIFGEHVVLRDLGSTNGTWVDNERIDRVTLNSQGEFRIGSHVLMFIVTDLD